MALAGTDITVLGAGIGGLAAAIALAQRGARVEVLEQAPELTEVGAGLQISHNGMVVLEALNVVAPNWAEGTRAVRSRGTRLVDGPSGKLVHTLPSPAAGPTFYFHRADLLALLETRARSLGVEIRLGLCIDLIDLGETGVELLLADGNCLPRQIVIAADGAHGPGRSFVTQPGKAAFSGQVAWRAAVDWEPEMAEPVAELAMAPGKHVVTYPLRGGAKMNLVAIEERDDWRGESWRETGDPGDFSARFFGFAGRAGEVIARAEALHRWALHLHPVAQRWHRGGVALLGDAAHPTLPFLAQGACLALEDAAVLALAMDGAGDLKSQWSAYESARAERAWKVVGAAQANAWRFHLGGPMRHAAQFALRMAGRWIAPDFDWVYSYEAARQKL